MAQSHLKNYIGFLQGVIKEMYNAIHYKQLEYPLKYIDRVYSKKHNHDICVIQLTGKNVFTKIPANEIIANENSLLEFSPIDIVKITQLAEEVKRDMRINQHKIHEIKRLDPDDNPLFIIKRIGLKNMRRLSSQDIVASGMLNNLSGADGYEVGYVEGIKSITTLRQDMEKARKEFSKKRKFQRLFVVK